MKEFQFEHTTKHQLPKEFATKWIEALRSGEYRQTTNRLFYHNRYCCLGVACRVVGISDKYLKTHDSIPPRAKKYNDVPATLRGNNFDELCSTCIDMNDNLGKTFSEIADWIEQNVKFV